FLAGDASLPPIRMQLVCCFRPSWVCLTGDVPLLPTFFERLVQRLAQRLHFFLPLFPNNIDLRVGCNGLERNMWHALIDKTVADVAMHRLRTRRCSSHFGFLELTFARIGEKVKRIACAH